MSKGRNKNKSWLMCTWALVMFCGIPGALAHKPVWSDGTNIDSEHALALETIDVSQVVYYEITADTPQLWMTFEGTKDQVLYLQLGVPVIDRLKDFRPAVAVLGPEWPAPAVPFSLPEGDGGLVFGTAGMSTPEVYHESFTGTDSWIFLEENVTLPATGKYYIAAYVPSGQLGKLWVSVGTKEEFGLKDLATFGETISKVRSFHEIPEPYCLCTGFFTLLGVILGTGFISLTKPGRRL
jgi:hypothetical protein